MQDRIGKNNKDVYNSIAKMINNKVKGEFVKEWNCKEDTSKIQEKRTRILNFLANAIECGFIISYSQLKTTIMTYKV